MDEKYQVKIKRFLTLLREENRLLKLGDADGFERNRVRVRKTVKDLESLVECEEACRIDTETLYDIQCLYRENIALSSFLKKEAMAKLCTVKGRRRKLSSGYLNNEHRTSGIRLDLLLK